MVSMKYILCENCYRKYEDAGFDLEVGEACQECQDKLFKICFPELAESEA